MKLTRKQQAVTCFGAAVFAAWLVFPPWSITHDRWHEPTEGTFLLGLPWMDDGHFSFSVYHFLIQCFVIALVGAVLLWVMRAQE